MNETPLWVKVTRLESFLKRYTPNGWKEPLHSVAYVPFISDDEYTAIETAYKNNNLETFLKNTDCFNEWYFIEAILSYFKNTIV